MPKIVATKLDWIKLGYKLFAESGEIGLNVDKMSRLLKCNKSSFYWHFKTKKEFVDALVEYWVSSDTNQIISRVNEQNTPKDKILKLMELVFKKDNYLDFIFYLKKYARKNKQTQKIIEQIDSERQMFVSKLLAEVGYSKKEANSKASILYKYLIGYHEMIRYKKQKKNYLSDVLKDMNQLINFQ